MPQYLTVKDLIKMYQVSKTTIYTWIDEGLPLYKFGRSTRFIETEVDEWLKNKFKVKNWNIIDG